MAESPHANHVLLDTDGSHCVRCTCSQCREGVADKGPRHQSSENTLEGWARVIAGAGRQEPQPVDPDADLHAMLDNVIRDVMLAKAALADEREGDLLNAVDLLLGRVNQIHALVGGW